MAKAKKKGGGTGASPPPSPQVGKVDDDPSPTEEITQPEEAAALIAQLQAQLQAAEAALQLSEARAGPLGAAAQNMPGGDGEGLSSVMTPPEPSVSSHASQSKPLVTQTDVKIEGHGPPNGGRVTERLVESLNQESYLDESEITDLLNKAVLSSQSHTQSEAATQGRNDAVEETHRVHSTELLRARSLMKGHAGSLYGYSVLSASEISRGSRATAFLSENNQNRFIAKTLTYKYHKEIFHKMKELDGVPLEEEPNEWLKGDSLVDLVHKTAAAANLLETGHPEDISEILMKCNQFAYTASNMATVHGIVMLDIFFVTNEQMSPGVQWTLREDDYSCVELWGDVKLPNFKRRDTRTEQIELMLILRENPGGHDAASLKLSETGKEWQDFMCTSNTFIEALDKATESYRADKLLGLYYDIDLPSYSSEISRMLRCFINLDSKEMNKSRIAQDASRDLVTMVRTAINQLKDLSGDELEVAVEIYRILGNIDFQQDLKPAEPSKRPASRGGFAAAATARGRDSTSRGGGGGGGGASDGWTRVGSQNRGRSHSRGPGRENDADAERCWICEKRDHSAGKCPKLSSEFIYPGLDGDVDDVECYTCHQIGHYRSDCPGPNAVRKIKAAYHKKENEKHETGTANRATRTSHRKKEKKRSPRSESRSSRRPSRAEEESTSESDTGTDASEEEEADTRGSWYNGDSDSDDNKK